MTTPIRARTTARRVALLSAAWALCLAPLAAGQPQPTAVAQEPDYSEYQRLLDDYLTVTSKPGEPIETRFNYVGLYANENASTRFAFARKGLFDVSPSSMKPEDRRAWAINAYNFLVIEKVTENLWDRWTHRYVKSNRITYRNRQKSVQYLKIDGLPFFEAPVVELDGEEYSLNRFERHFIFLDYDSTSHKPPPPGLDPRAHFALVCGAMGCPPLMPRCYQADSLDQELDFAVRNALSSPAHLRWDPATGRLDVSEIFHWYAGDFGGREKAFAFIKRYAPDSVRTDPQIAKKHLWSSYVTWDWEINQTPRDERNQ